MYEHVVSQWQEVARIPFGRVMADDRESLLEFIEEPLREAVGIMFDKQIPTVGSSCNISDYAKGKAWITVDYDYMSSRNRKVVDRHDLVEKFPIRNQNIVRTVTVAGLFFPIEPHELPRDIGQKAVALAEQFQVQPNLLPRKV